MAFTTRGGLDQTGFRRARAASQQFFRMAAPEMLTKQGRLLIRDLIKLTPGFVPGAGIQASSLASHKRITDSAVKRDIRKVFQPVQDTGLYKSTGRAGDRLRQLLSGTKRATRDGKSEAAGNRALAIQAIFKAATGTTFNIVGGATRARHVAARDRRGRVRGKTPVLVLDKRSVTEYTKEVLKHVGRGKAGWERAGTALGTTMPNWITRHDTPGYFIDNRKHPTSPSITVINSVPYRGAFETKRITSAALAIRAQSMVTEMRKVRAGMARAFRRKAA